MEIDNIKTSICNIKGRRNKILWLIKNLHHREIYIGYCQIEVNFGHICYVKCKPCALCKTDKCQVEMKRIRIIKNNNIFVYYACRDCNICKSCLRETSRCKQIHTRKLLCYKFLLFKKFPKDIVHLITKKVK